MTTRPPSISLTALLLCLTAAPLRLAQAQSAPPLTPKREVADTYFGTVITDPYRWMEPPVDRNPEFMEWLRRQNAYTREVLDSLPQRPRLLARLLELADITTSVSVVIPADRRWFYLKLAPGEQVPKLYVRDLGAKSDRLLLDPVPSPSHPIVIGPSTMSCPRRTESWWHMAPPWVARSTPCCT